MVHLSDDHAYSRHHGYSRGKILFVRKRLSKQMNYCRNRLSKHINYSKMKIVFTLYIVHYKGPWLPTCILIFIHVCLCLSSMFISCCFLVPVFGVLCILQNRFPGSTTCLCCFYLFVKSR